MSFICVCFLETWKNEMNVEILSIIYGIKYSVIHINSEYHRMIKSRSLKSECFGRNLKTVYSNQSSR